MSLSPTTGSPGIVLYPFFDRVSNRATMPRSLPPFVLLCSLLPDADSWALIASFFTYRPAKWNPPQENLRKSVNLFGGGFPAHENTRPHQGGPGIFACGCRGGITHYTLPSARCAPGDTPGPRMRLCPCLMAGLCRRFCALFIPYLRRQKHRPRGGTMDGGRELTGAVRWRIFHNGHKNGARPKTGALNQNKSTRLGANRMLTVIRKTCRKDAFPQSPETTRGNGSNPHEIRLFRRFQALTKTHKIQ